MEYDSLAEIGKLSTIAEIQIFSRGLFFLLAQPVYTGKWIQDLRREGFVSD